MMSEARNAAGELVKDIRFIFPLVGTIVLTVLLLEFEHLGQQQELVPVVVIYTLFATVISSAHTSSVYILEDWIGRDKYKTSWQRIALSVIALLIQAGWCGAVVYFLHYKAIF